MAAATTATQGIVVELRLCADSEHSTCCLGVGSELSVGLSAGERHRKM